MITTDPGLNIQFGHEQHNIVYIFNKTPPMLAMIATEAGLRNIQLGLKWHRKVKRN
jgi:hypothetical protein